MLAWLVLLGFMFLAAWTVRDARYRAQSRLITRHLTRYAETGDMTDPLSPGTPWSFNRYLWDYQGPMVWLIEHGYRDPAMLRVMLLCEARRSVDATYLYTRCYNWDLREHLITECRAAYPEDPLVAWACGRCYLAAGEYEQAAVELLAARKLRLDCAAAGITEEHLTRRIITAMIMNGMPDGAVEYARDLVEDASSPENYLIHSELLCLLERYPEALTAAVSRMPMLPCDVDLQDVIFRSLWWSGDFHIAQDQAWVLAGSNPADTKLAEHDWRKILAANKLGIGQPTTVIGEIPYYEAISEWAAITGDYTDLTAMLEEISRLDTTMSSYPRLQPIDDNWFDRADQAVLRAYVLTHQWDKLHATLAETDEPGWGNPHSGYQTAILLDSIAQTGSPPTEINPYWDFRELVEGGTLPYLLYSSHFAAAAEYAGRDVDEVRAEVVSALAPVREEYHDYTNGTLDW